MADDDVTLRQEAGKEPDDLWHKADVDKSDPYVGEMLQAQLQQAEVDLRFAKLAGIQLPAARLAELDLTAADLRDANLAAAILRKARLTNANLRRANLNKADLSEADLKGADLTQAHLGEANLQGANLQGAQINDTILLGSDLREANLQGAQIGSFSWNRLTRFSGIKGFQPEPEADTEGSGDDIATAAFAAPLAMADHDISDRRRAIVGQQDPSLSQTHVYRAKGKGTSKLRPATAHVGVSTEALVKHNTDDLTTRSTVARDQQETVKTAAPPPPTDKRLKFIAIITSLIGCVGFAVGLISFIANKTPETENIITDIGQIDGSDSDSNLPRSDAELRTYRRRIAALTAELKSLENHNNSLQANISEEQAARREVELRNRWLRTRHDETAVVIDEHDALKKKEHNNRIRNQRLEETARILARGVKELEKENGKIKEEIYSQVQDRHRIQELTAQVDLLKATAKATNDHLEAVKLRNRQLEQDLGAAERSMASIHRRIQGTALEQLLGELRQDAPLVDLEPGKTVTFGGTYLISLRVDQSKRSDSIDIDLVLQTPPDGLVPEMNLILYGQNGKPIRKLSASFPDSRGSDGFASFKSTISGKEFPSQARLVLAPAMPPDLADKDDNPASDS